MGMDGFHIRRNLKIQMAGVYTRVPSGFHLLSSAVHAERPPHNTALLSSVSSVGTQRRCSGSFTLQPVNLFLSPSLPTCVELCTKNILIFLRSTLFLPLNICLYTISSLISNRCLHIFLQL